MLKRLHGRTRGRPLMVLQWAALLVVACILPAIIVVGYLIEDSYVRERAVAEQAAVHIARALMQAVDRELASAEAALLALSVSDHLNRGDSDISAFQDQAIAVALQRRGNDIMLHSAEGELVLHTGSEEAAGIVPADGLPSVQGVVLTGRPRISDLQRVDGTYFTTVDVPVVRGGRVEYVLSMQYALPRLEEVLLAQRIPPDWVVTLFDGHLHVVARSRDAAQYTGRLAPAGLVALAPIEQEGTLEDVTLENIPAIVAFSRSAVSNWTVAISMPTESLTAPLQRGVSALAGASALLLGIGLAFAALIGRRLASAIRALVAPARALGEGASDAELRVDTLNLWEAREVGRALMQAAELIRRRTAERDLAERTEHELREAKRDIEAREAFLRGVFEETPDAALLVDEQGRVRRAGVQAARLFRSEAEQLVDRRIDELLFIEGGAEDRPLQRMLDGLRTRGPLAYGLPLRARQPGGAAVPVDVMASPFAAPEGRLYIITARDMSEREARERALSESEQRLLGLTRRLELATRAGHIAVWDWDLASGELVWDERMRELYEMPAHATPTVEAWRDRVHPEDLSRVELRREQAQKAGDEIANEYRVVLPGVTRTIQSYAVVVRNEDGKAVRLIGVNIDVTESRERERALGAALSEKETLLKELYHRVKNNLQVVSSLLNLQMRALPDGRSRNVLSDAASRVRAMSLVHEKLYQSRNLSSIWLDEYVQELCAQLAQTAGGEQRGIAFSIDIPRVSIGIEIAIPLGLILNELVSNSLKHAFPEGTAGRITVSAERKEGKLRMLVADDGIGLPHPWHSMATSSSLGLSLVAALSRQIDASLQVESEHGTRATLLLAVPFDADPSAATTTGEMDDISA